jgi:predicted lysophospholipase L1 biosynthesis ABC-type transport system permease subunit
MTNSKVEEPTTAAGRALLESEMFDRLILSLGQNAAVGEDEFAAAIIAIEAEARADGYEVGYVIALQEAAG